MQSRRSGCLVTSGRFRPSADDEEWSFSEKAFSTVAMQHSDLHAEVKYNFWLLASYHKPSLVSRFSYYYTPYIPFLNDSWGFIQFLPITSHIVKETPNDLLLHIHVLLVLLSFSWILLIIKSELLSWPYMRPRKCTINVCQYTVYSAIVATSNLGWCIALSTLQKLYSNSINVRN